MINWQSLTEHTVILSQCCVGLRSSGCAALLSVQFAPTPPKMITHTEPAFLVSFFQSLSLMLLPQQTALVVLHSSSNVLQTPRGAATLFWSSCFVTWLPETDGKSCSVHLLCPAFHQFDLSLSWSLWFLCVVSFLHNLWSKACSWEITSLLLLQECWSSHRS